MKINVVFEVVSVTHSGELLLSCTLLSGEMAAQGIIMTCSIRPTQVLYKHYLWGGKSNVEKQILEVQLN